jgi:putative ABC transport system permease protein
VLGFALVFAAAAAALPFALEMVERRRTYALTAALGARPRQVAAFLWSEAGFVTVTGVVAGAVAGWLLSVMLVAVLTGVFDPAPASLAVPWGYLGAALSLALAALFAVVRGGRRALVRSPVSVLREL